MSGVSEGSSSITNPKPRGGGTTCSGTPIFSCKTRDDSLKFSNIDGALAFISVLIVAKL